MSAFGRFCWKSRRWKSVKFYTCFDASVLERRDGPHSPHPTYSMTLTLALRHVCSIVGTSFPRGANFAVGGNRTFSTESVNCGPFKVQGTQLALPCCLRGMN